MRDEPVALARVRRAEMVRAFIISGEYRGRFAGDASRGNQFGSIAMLKSDHRWWEDAAWMMRSNFGVGLNPRRGRAAS